MKAVMQVTLCVSLSAVFAACVLGQSQSTDRATGITQPVAFTPPVVPTLVISKVDDSRLVRLKGNTHPMARKEFDKGAVDPQMPMQRLLLVLKRSPEQESALEVFMARQLDPKSPDFHHWLTPEQFGSLYGPSENDIAAVTNWLQNHGFSIGNVAAGRTFIEFSGTAELVQAAFHTEIHRYEIKGEMQIANSSDPSIPEALSPVVAGVFSMNTFVSKPLHRDLGAFHRSGKKGGWEPDNPNILLKPLFGLSFGGTQMEWVAPYDFATIYNVLPLWSAGIDGTGTTIAIPGRSDIDLSDIAAFRSAFGLPANVPTVIVNGTDPKEPSVEDRVEATVDLEWAGAIAKGAKLIYVETEGVPPDPQDVTSDGTFLSALYIIDHNLAPIMSYSYGDCEYHIGTTGNSAFNSLWQQGAAQGISEFVASGDSGSAACDGGQAPPYIPQYGYAVNGSSSTPYDTAVGGTDLQWANLTGTYWNSTNSNTNFSSALGYIPEVPWNGSCASQDVLMLSGLTAIGFDNEEFCNFINEIGFDGQFLDATGGTGGPSSCTTPGMATGTVADCAGGYPKPAWQAGTGVPSDGKRDVPDVSLFASNAALNSAYVFCDSEIGPCDYSVTDDALALGVGGTSLSSPAMAGIMAMILQKVGGAAQGLANPVLYQLASQENLSTCNSSTVTSGNSCVFYDITSDNIRVPCATGSLDCTTNTSGDAVGIMNGYDATAGYDLATGLGSVNAYNLVNTWYNPAAPSVMTSPAPGSTLAGPVTTFTWTAGPTGTTAYYLWVGTTPGGIDLVNQGLKGTSLTVTLPTNGATIYVRLWTVTNGVFHYNSYTYTESSAGPAAMVTPAPGSTLTGPVTTFTWTTGPTGTTAYYLWVGTAFGTNNLVNIGLHTTTYTVNLPTNGAALYVRLWTVINGQFVYKDYTYTEASAGISTMISPVPGSTLTSPVTTFTWTTGPTGTTANYLWVGTAFGTNNLVNIGLHTTTYAVSLPTNGATLYVRLWTVVNGQFLYNDYTYTEASGSGLATMISPTPGTTLSGSMTTFTWNPGASNTTAYYLWVGTAPGLNDLVNIGLHTTTYTANLPTNGAPLYVRLWTVFNGTTFLYNQYTYTEAP